MTITEALRVASRYVEEHKATMVWDGPEMPGPEKEVQIAVELAVLGHDLDSLASAPLNALRTDSPTISEEVRRLHDCL